MLVPTIIWFGILVDVYFACFALATATAILVLWWLSKCYLDRHVPYIGLGAVLGGALGSKPFAGFESGHVGAALLGRGTGSTFWRGLIVGGVFALLYLKVKKIPFSLAVDDLAIAVATGICIGRVGCFLSGDGCYGVPSSLPWAMSFPHGLVPAYSPVHPTPLYESLSMLLILQTWIGAGGQEECSECVDNS